MGDMKDKIFNTTIEGKMKEAGDPVVNVVEIININSRVIRSIKRLKYPEPIYSQCSDRFEWSYDSYLSLTDIRECIGCSKLRFNHSIERLFGNTYNFKDEKRSRGVKCSTERLYNSKMISHNKELWIEDDHSHTPIQKIVADLATRRPALPKSKAWAKELGIALSNIK